MNFSISLSIELLQRTPKVLKEMLAGISEEWTSHNEGDDTWTPFDVIGHLIHGEKKDWLARTEIILSDKAEKKFIPFDRFAQFEESKGKTLAQLLDEFEEARKLNISKLKQLNITDDDLKKTGTPSKVWRSYFVRITFGLDCS